MTPTPRGLKPLGRPEELQQQPPSISRDMIADTVNSQALDLLSSSHIKPGMIISSNDIFGFCTFTPSLSPSLSSKICLEKSNFKTCYSTKMLAIQLKTKGNPRLRKLLNGYSTFCPSFLYFVNIKCCIQPWFFEIIQFLSNASHKFLYRFQNLHL